MSKYNFLEKYTFKNGATTKNRIVMAPMTTKASFYNGAVTGDEIEYYRLRSGGVGMLITGVANVTENGKGFEGELSITNDKMIEGLKKLASAIKIDGTKAILQIFHAGRKSMTSVLKGEQPVSASAIAAVYPPNSEIPRALEDTEIKEIISAFGEATKRAIEAGFDGIEIHGANTYLIQQFFSPNSNQRTDNWGGDIDKRMNFALEILKITKENIEKYGKKDFILGYRISPEEIETPGIRLEDTLYFIDKIKDKIDYIHLSMGYYNRTSLNNKDDNRTILSQVKEVIKNEIPIISVGSVITPNDAENVLKSGADFVALGRMMIREPKWVQKVLNNDEKSIRTKLSISDMDELLIPAGMQEYLVETYSEVMNFSTVQIDNSFDKNMAPMEGYKKK